MQLPDAANALVEEAEITEYLLSETHPDGQNKAEFFRRFGFGRKRWQILAEALRRHGATHAVTGTVESAYGTRYVVDGSLETPDGRHPQVRTVWIVDTGESRPRLVTSYPL